VSQLIESCLSRAGVWARRGRQITDQVQWLSAVNGTAAGDAVSPCMLKRGSALGTLSRRLPRTAVRAKLYR
jgi:hypothetical protein